MSKPLSCQRRDRIRRNAIGVLNGKVSQVLDAALVLKGLDDSSADELIEAAEKLSLLVEKLSSQGGR